MENFKFHAYTEILFGKGEIKKLQSVMEKYGKNVLLLYGGGSIKKNGIYDEVYSLLGGFNIFELGGVEPNPRIETVRLGIEICRREKIDVVLAAGGGSVIDCGKVIAAGVDYEGDAWDIVLDPSKIKKVLPIVTILTLAATGSEMNKNAVISDMTLNDKIGTGHWDMIPKASILDPTYMYTLPPIQTAAGTADIMSHVIENYFKREKGAFIQDRFSEGILEACIKYCPIALKEPQNYEARANLMWASTTALNGLCGVGKGGAWSCHSIEHQLSAYYDITHGVGLAIIIPKWMRYVLNEETVDKFCDYAVNVWHFEEKSDNVEDRFALANKGIDATEKFFLDCGIPANLSELGIGEEKFEEMAEKATSGGKLDTAYVPLNKEDVVKIYRMCL